MRPYRLLASLLLVAITSMFCCGWADDTPKADKPISVADASKMVDKKVTLRMLVKSSAARGNHFLNSETDYKDEKNFTIFIPRDAVDNFKKAKIENPAEHFKGKTILVSGTVVLYQKRVEIIVEDPAQIKIDEKK